MKKSGLEQKKKYSSEQMKEFGFEQINKTLGNLVSEQKLNYAKVLFADPKAKMSVTAKFAPALRGEQYCILDGDLNTVMSKDVDSFYYGASPILDSHKIVEAISQMRLNSAEKIDAFISENASLFMLHENQKEYLLSFARYIVIAYAGNYGIYLQFPIEIDIKSDINSYLKTGQCSISDNGTVCLHGCPSADLLAVLNKYRFVKSEINNKNNGKLTTVWRYVEYAGESVERIYSLPGSVILLNGTVFYSGVLIKPLKIEKEPNEFENDGIVSVVIHFERSTYAVVYSMDNNFINHPLLEKTSREKLIRFFNEDDEQKRSLLNAAAEADKDSIFDVVTEYLMKCHNINQIGISGTVVTKDGIVVLSWRNSRAIDGGLIYPGVNGNAELYDRGVSFYNKSVYEDVPTIKFNDDRLDFQGEICREAYAELALTFEKHMCTCRSIVLSGNIPGSPSSESEYIEKDRRMHFNIIFDQQCDKSFDELLVCHKQATESFENKDLLGMRLKCYHSVNNFIQQKMQDALKCIVESKDFLESLLILVLFFCTMIGNGVRADISVESVVSYILAVLIFTANFIKGRTAIRTIRYRNKHIRNVVIFKKMKLDKIYGIEKDFFGNSKYHPVTATLIKLYIENTAYNSFWMK